ncbi:hypothetical protein [Marivita sp.]|uniref:hypothetical protein n=1 Tax=Marivita sp. TaxID=2003365 RepID=UPI003F725012
MKRYFTISQAVDYSARSRSSLYKANKLGQLTLTKIDGSTLIERCDLDAYLDAKAEKVAA